MLVFFRIRLKYTLVNPHWNAILGEQSKPTEWALCENDNVFGVETERMESKWERKK